LSGAFRGAEPLSKRLGAASLREFIRGVDGVRVERDSGKVVARFSPRFAFGRLSPKRSTKKKVRRERSGGREFAERKPAGGHAQSTPNVDVVRERVKQIISDGARNGPIRIADVGQKLRGMYREYPKPTISLGYQSLTAFIKEIEGMVFSGEGAQRAVQYVHVPERDRRDTKRQGLESSQDRNSSERQKLEGVVRSILEETAASGRALNTASLGSKISKRYDGEAQVYKKLGFSKLKLFLETMPDVVLEGEEGNPNVVLASKQGKPLRGR